MFELKIAFKYLLFKKRRLSASLISLLSIVVISLVVWVVLVFLSVTNGIEKNWLNKLTSVNAPIRITPTQSYFSSYYYLIDSYCAESNFETKTIYEKSISDSSDPYDPNLDINLPLSLPNPTYDNLGFVDPIKRLYAALENQKKIDNDFHYQDYEISAAILRLSLNREKKDLLTNFKEATLSFLTQMTYLLSETDLNPNFQSLLLPYSQNDINHLLSQIDKSYSSDQKDIPSHPSMLFGKKLSKRINELIENISLKKITLEKNYPINLDLFKSNKIEAFALIDNNKILNIVLPSDSLDYSKYVKGKIIKDNDLYYFTHENKRYLMSKYLHLSNPITLDATFDKSSFMNAMSINDIKLNVQSDLKGYEIAGTIPFKDIKLSDYDIKKEKIDTYLQMISKDKTAILLPKQYQGSNVLIGDTGYLSFATMGIMQNQEMRLPVYVKGFYDPGILPIGSRSIIVPKEIVKTINSTNNNFSFDGSSLNGIFVWIKDLKQVDVYKNKIQKDLEDQNIATYFKIETYKDFEFSKDLMQQFQSDKTLFSLIAIIVLIAACSNIISMLVLLVNDKKSEIAILRSMGASTKSITFIFGFSGFFLGILSSGIGVLLSIFTLRHLDSLISFLSALQGHSFFNAAFFGSKMPNEISISALLFVLIITPIISLIAGIIPAIKAAKIHPSSILRS
jgi:lipoprotein-releasing system permease protein